MKKILFFTIFLSIGSIFGQEIVYTIPAQSAVSPSGAATYNIPIEVPAGTNGFQPNISIVYNSQSGMGNLGLGWDVSGVSAITRGVKSIYYDNTQPRNLPEFNNNDQLYLDGQRLILLSGYATHFQVGALYGFEAENYSRVTIKQDGDNVYFELKTVDGNIFEYGKDAELRDREEPLTINTVTPNITVFPKTFAWKLHKAIDVFGNEINYKYSSCSRTLTEIFYCNELNTIEFYYQKNNTNPQKKFISGFPLSQDSVLSRIEVKVNNTLTKSYSFNYNLTSNLCRLSSVKLYDGSVSPQNLLGTTFIDWGECDNETQIIELNYPDSLFSSQVDGSYFLSGDIDGDGYKDIVYAFSGDFSFNGQLRVYLKEAMSNEITFYTKNVNARMINTPAKFVVADIDMDGKDEIISVQYTNVYYYAKASYDNISPMLIVRVFKYDEQTKMLYEHHSSSIQSDGLFQENYFYGKYNFNIFVTNYDKNTYPDLYIEEYYNKGNNPNALVLHVYCGCIFGALLYHGKQTLPTLSSDKGLYGQEVFGDFDSDGILDIVHPRPHGLGDMLIYGGTGVKIWELTFLDTENHYLFGSSSSHAVKFRNIYPIDANSDNSTDLLVQYNASNGNSWKLLQVNLLYGVMPVFSELDVPFETAYPHPNCQYSDHEHTLIIDYDGDGQQDVVIADAIYNSDCQWQSTQWFFYKNNNGYFILEKQFSTDKPLSKINPVAIDVNYDGIQDIAWLSYNYPSASKIKAITFPHISKKYYVKKITNNFGQSEEFTYKNNTSFEKPLQCDTDDCLFESQIRTLNLPIMLVDRHKQLNGETVEYQFTKAKMHKTKGFLGFEKIVANNITTGAKTESNYAVVNTNRYFNIALTSQKDSVNHQLVSTTNFYNRDIAPSSNRYIPVVDSIVSVDVLNNITKRKISTFDNLGRLTSEKLLEGDYQTVTTYSSFIAKNQSPIAYLPQSKNIKYQKGAEIKEYLTNLTYNDKGQIASQTNFANKSGNIVTTYEHYPSGNLKKVLKNVSGLPQSSLEYQYDSKFRYELKKINSIGQFSQRTIDTIKGLLLSEAGIDGLTTSYTYNTAGQITSKTEANGVITNYLYNKDTAHGALYKITETIPSINSQIISYYDSVGREVYKTQTGANANLLHSSKQYNAKNQLVKEFLPHETSEEAAYQQYAYDYSNRVTIATKFDGVFTNRTHYIYASKLVATMDMIDYQQTGTTNLDDAGLVISKSDRGGTITYSYNAEKQPVKILVGGVETQRITYDQYGYQDSLIDAHAGEIVYQNYPDGKVKQKISPKNNRTAYQYDALGRIIIERTLDGDSAHTYAYSYIAGGNGIGQLASETYYVRQISRGSDGGIQIGADLHITIDMHVSLDKIIHKKCYSYNSNHLLLSDTNIYENVKYVNSYTYDNLWRLKTQKSPSSVTTTYIYDNYGNISQIKVNNSAVWTQNEISAKGKIKQFTLGNGLVENRTYLNNSLISNQTVNNSTVALFSQSYNYNRHYNLTLRNNPLYGRKETFTYDNLDRLIAINDSAKAATYPITYASNGNITNKYDAGQYVYSAAPYRLMDVYETDTNYNNGVGGKFEYLDYNYFNKATLIELGGSKYSLYYGVDKQRIKSIDSTSTQKTVRYYFGSYEKEIINDTATHIDYIFAPSGLALIVKTHIATAAVGKGVGGIGDGIATTHPGIPSGYDFYYVSTDNLGSIVMITNPSKTVLSKYYYQPFGGRVLLTGTDITPRGYTFHEHLATFGLINMNGRFYDPVLARFLSPDPYVQMPDFTQNYNRYSYALNNPFKFTDPSGEVLWFVPVIIGAVIGIYQGGVLANGGEYNLAKWDWRSGKTWGYMLGGAVVGGLSGFVGGAVATSGIPFANTFGLMAASFINAAGTHLYTGGQTSVSINLGVASYDITNNTWGYLGKKGNKWYENVGYGLGALANVSDILMGLQPKGIDLVTDKHDGTGHSAIVEEGTKIGGYNDPNGIVSVGPDRFNPINADGSWHWMKGTNKWSTYANNKNVWRQTLNVNKQTIVKYGQWLDKLEVSNKLIYSVELSSCVTHTSIALNLSGVFNIGIHPYLLNAQMYLWSNGIRPWTFSYFLNQ